MVVGKNSLRWGKEIAFGGRGLLPGRGSSGARRASWVTGASVALLIGPLANPGLAQDQGDPVDGEEPAEVEVGSDWLVAWTGGGDVLAGSEVGLWLEPAPVAIPVDGSLIWRLPAGEVETAEGGSETTPAVLASFDEVGQPTRIVVDLVVGDVVVASFDADVAAVGVRSVGVPSDEVTPRAERGVQGDSGGSDAGINGSEGSTATGAGGSDRSDAVSSDEVRPLDDLFSPGLGAEGSTGVGAEDLAGVAGEPSVEPSSALVGDDSLSVGPVVGPGGSALASALEVSAGDRLRLAAEFLQSLVDAGLLSETEATALVRSDRALAELGLRLAGEEAGVSVTTGELLPDGSAASARVSGLLELGAQIPAGGPVPVPGESGSLFLSFAPGFVPEGRRFDGSDDDRYAFGLAFLDALVQSGLLDPVDAAGLAGDRGLVVDLGLVLQNPDAVVGQLALGVVAGVAGERLDAALVGGSGGVSTSAVFAALLVAGDPRRIGDVLREAGYRVDSVRVVDGIAGDKVRGGDGNDVVIVLGDISRGGKVDLKKGNDLVVVLGDVVGESELDLDRGDDTAVVFGYAGGLSKIEGNRGNDQVGLVGVAGDGLKLDLGRDDDQVLTAGIVRDLLIDGDKGDDTATVVGDVTGLDFEGEKGDDGLTVIGDLADSRVDGDKGADSFTATGSVVDSFLEFNKGADRVDITGRFERSRLETDKHNDIVRLTGLFADAGIELGRGDDVFEFTGQLLDSVVDAGRGDDRLGLDGAIGETVVEGGRGADLIDLRGLGLPGFVIDLGKNKRGDDVLQVNDDFRGELDIQDPKRSFQFKGSERVRQQDIVRLLGDGYQQVEDPDGGFRLQRIDPATGELLTNIGIVGDPDHLERILAATDDGVYQVFQNLEPEVKTRLASTVISVIGTAAGIAAGVASLVVSGGATTPLVLALASSAAASQTASSIIDKQDFGSVVLDAVGSAASIAGIPQLQIAADVVRAVDSGDLLGAALGGVGLLLDFGGLGDDVVDRYRQAAGGLQTVINGNGDTLQVLSGLATIAAASAPNGPKGVDDNVLPGLRGNIGDIGTGLQALDAALDATDDSAVVEILGALAGLGVTAADLAGGSDRLVADVGSAQVALQAIDAIVDEDYVQFLLSTADLFERTGFGTRTENRELNLIDSEGNRLLLPVQSNTIAGVGQIAAGIGALVRGIDTGNLDAEVDNISGALGRSFFNLSGEAEPLPVTGIVPLLADDGRELQAVFEDGIPVAVFDDRDQLVVEFTALGEDLFGIVSPAGQTTYILNNATGEVIPVTIENTDQPGTDVFAGEIGFDDLRGSQGGGEVARNPGQAFNLLKELNRTRLGQEAIAQQSQALSDARSRLVDFGETQAFVIVTQTLEVAGSGGLARDGGVVPTGVRTVISEPTDAAFLEQFLVPQTIRPEGDASVVHRTIVLKGPISDQDLAELQSRLPGRDLIIRATPLPFFPDVRPPGRSDGGTADFPIVAGLAADGDLGDLNASFVPFSESLQFALTGNSSDGLDVLSEPNLIASTDVTIGDLLIEEPESTGEAAVFPGAASEFRGQALANFRSQRELQKILEDAAARQNEQARSESGSGAAVVFGFVADRLGDVRSFFDTSALDAAVPVFFDPDDPSKKVPAFVELNAGLLNGFRVPNSDVPDGYVPGFAGESITNGDLVGAGSALAGGAILLRGGAAAGGTLLRTGAVLEATDIANAASGIGNNFFKALSLYSREETGEANRRLAAAGIDAGSEILQELLIGGVFRVASGQSLLPGPSELRVGETSDGQPIYVDVPRYVNVIEGAPTPDSSPSSDGQTIVARTTAADLNVDLSGGGPSFVDPDVDGFIIDPFSRRSRPETAVLSPEIREQLNQQAADEGRRIQSELLEDGSVFESGLAAAEEFATLREVAIAFNSDTNQDTLVLVVPTQANQGNTTLFGFQVFEVNRSLDDVDSLFTKLNDANILRPGASVTATINGNGIDGSSFRSPIGGEAGRTATRVEELLAQPTLPVLQAPTLPGLVGPSPSDRLTVSPFPPDRELGPIPESGSGSVSSGGLGSSDFVVEVTPYYDGFFYLNAKRTRNRGGEVAGSFDVESGQLSIGGVDSSQTVRSNENQRVESSDDDGGALIRELVRAAESEGAITSVHLETVVNPQVRKALVERGPEVANRLVVRYLEGTLRDAGYEVSGDPVLYVAGDVADIDQGIVEYTIPVRRRPPGQNASGTGDGGQGGSPTGPRVRPVSPSSDHGGSGEIGDVGGLIRFARGSESVLNGLSLDELLGSPGSSVVVPVFPSVVPGVGRGVVDPGAFTGEVVLPPAGGVVSGVPSSVGGAGVLDGISGVVTGPLRSGTPADALVDARRLNSSDADSSLVVFRVRGEGGELVSHTALVPRGSEDVVLQRLGAAGGVEGTAGQIAAENSLVATPPVEIPLAQPGDGPTVFERVVEVPPVGDRGIVLTRPPETVVETVDAQGLPVQITEQVPRSRATTRPVLKVTFYGDTNFGTGNVHALLEILETDPVSGRRVVSQARNAFVQQLPVPVDPDSLEPNLVLGAEFWHIPDGWSIDSMSDDWFRVAVTGGGVTFRAGPSRTSQPVAGSPKYRLETEFHNRWATTSTVLFGNFSIADKALAIHDLIGALRPGLPSVSWRHADVNNPVNTPNEALAEGSEELDLPLAPGLEPIQELTESRSRDEFSQNLQDAFGLDESEADQIADQFEQSDPSEPDPPPDDTDPTDDPPQTNT